MTVSGEASPNCVPSNTTVLVLLRRAGSTDHYISRRACGPQENDLHHCYCNTWGWRYCSPSGGFFASKEQVPAQKQAEVNATTSERS